MYIYVYMYVYIYIHTHMGIYKYFFCWHPTFRQRPGLHLQSGFLILELDHFWRPQRRYGDLLVVLRAVH